MEKNHSFLESECAPQLECFFTKEKAELLRVKLPNSCFIFLLALRHRLKAADMLHNVVGQAKCLGNIVVRVYCFWFALVFNRAKAKREYGFLEFCLLFLRQLLVGDLLHRVLELLSLS